MKPLNDLQSHRHFIDTSTLFECRGFQMACELSQMFRMRDGTGISSVLLRARRPHFVQRGLLTVRMLLSRLETHLASSLSKRQRTPPPPIGLGISRKSMEGFYGPIDLQNPPKKSGNAYLDVDGGFSLSLAETR